MGKVGLYKRIKEATSVQKLELIKTGLNSDKESDRVVSLTLALELGDKNDEDLRKAIRACTRRSVAGGAKQNEWTLLAEALKEFGEEEDRAALLEMASRAQNIFLGEDMTAKMKADALIGLAKFDDGAARVVAAEILTDKVIGSEPAKTAIRVLDRQDWLTTYLFFLKNEFSSMNTEIIKVGLSVLLEVIPNRALPRLLGVAEREGIGLLDLTDLIVGCGRTDFLYVIEEMLGTEEDDEVVLAVGLTLATSRNEAAIETLLTVAKERASDLNVRESLAKAVSMARHPRKESVLALLGKN